MKIRSHFEAVFKAAFDLGWPYQPSVMLLRSRLKMQPSKNAALELGHSLLLKSKQKLGTQSLPSLHVINTLKYTFINYEVKTINYEEGRFSLKQ